MIIILWPGQRSTCTLLHFQVGGIILPSDSLIVTDIQSYLYYESFIQLDQSGGLEMVGGHPGARLWSQTVSLFLQQEPELEISKIYLRAANLRPESTTQLSGSSPLRDIADVRAEVRRDNSRFLDYSYHHSSGCKLWVL